MNYKVDSADEHKYPVQLAHEKKRLTHPCPECGMSNLPEGKFKIYDGSPCKYCGAKIDDSYIFAPWSYTWEELQALTDRVKQLFEESKKRRDAKNRKN